MKTSGPQTEGLEQEVLVVMAKVVLDCELVADDVKTCLCIFFWSVSLMSLKFTNLRWRLPPRFAWASAMRRQKASYWASAFSATRNPRLLGLRTHDLHVLHPQVIAAASKTLEGLAIVLISSAGIPIQRLFCLAWNAGVLSPPMTFEKNP
jgi:hypothetical protein